MADLIATKALKYATRRLLPDDHFTTKNERDARILIGIGKARRASLPQLDHDRDSREGGSKLSEENLTALRAEYQRVVGKRPFNGWDAATLREKIAAA